MVGVVGCGFLPRKPTEEIMDSVVIAVWVIVALTLLVLVWYRDRSERREAESARDVTHMEAMSDFADAMTEIGRASSQSSTAHAEAIERMMTSVADRQTELVEKLVETFLPRPGPVVDPVHFDDDGQPLTDRGAAAMETVMDETDWSRDFIRDGGRAPLIREWREGEEPVSG